MLRYQATYRDVRSEIEIGRRPTVDISYDHELSLEHCALMGTVFVENFARGSGIADTGRRHVFVIGTNVGHDDGRVHVPWGVHLPNPHELHLTHVCLAVMRCPGGHRVKEVK
jgi:hypothetical protein